MMNRALKAAVVQAVTLGCVQASVCTSSDFRKEFFAGWEGAVDEASESTGLAKYGDAAVPCLKAIVLNGGREIGESCVNDPSKCESWAIKALTEIETTSARRAVVGLLSEVKSPVTLGNLVSAVGNAKIQEARAPIRAFLKRAEPHLRSQAVVALGSIGTEEDLAAMLAVTRALPADYEDDIIQAVIGIEMLGSPVAIAPLERFAKGTRSEWVRKNMELSIVRLRTKCQNGARSDPGENEGKPSHGQAPQW